MIYWSESYDLFDFSFGAGPSVIRSQLEERQAADQALHNETIMKLVFDEDEIRMVELFRSLVQSDALFVAVNSDESFHLTNITAKKYRLASEPDKSKNANQKKKGGNGGNLVAVHDAPPTRHPDNDSGQMYREINGRDLVRSIPENADGILIHLSGSSPAEIGREYFTELRSIADACDLEDLLVIPAPGQTEAILNATWLVRIKENGALFIDRTTDEGWLAEAFTHRNHVSVFYTHEVVEMTGEKLFRLVCQNAEVDGIMINCVSKIGKGSAKMHRMVMSVGEVSGILSGEDNRPGVFPLPARNMDEVELWLNSRNFPHAGRTFVDATKGGVKYTVAVTEAGSSWRMQESFANQFDYKGPTISPVFSVSNEPQNDRPSEILCPGLIAKALNVGAYQAADAAKYWNVGSNFIFARFIDAQDRERSRKRASLAKELAKFLPPGANEIPRSAFRTVHGAALIRKHPYGATREWIEATIKKAERCTNSWLFG